jgi:hypothetical protein
MERSEDQYTEIKEATRGHRVTTEVSADRSMRVTV